ncbi:MAG: hypothetical protein ACK475_09450, partial [Bacteroidota bacterium]
MRTRLHGMIITALFAATVAGCELFVIGSTQRRAPVIERSQRSSAGVVHVFKAEIDSGNTTAATELMVGPT